VNISLFFVASDITRDYFYKNLVKVISPWKLWELLFGYLPSKALLLSACLHCKQQHGFTRSMHMQTLQTMSQRCCTSNIRVFGLPVHEKMIFLKFIKFYLFLSLMGPQKVPSPLIFANLKPHTPKMLPTKFG